MFATGSSPGFITHMLPLTLLSLQRRVDLVEIFEYANMSRRDSPHMLFEQIGFGAPMPDAPAVARPVRTPPAVAIVADAAGKPADSWTFVDETAAAQPTTPGARGSRSPPAPSAPGAWSTPGQHDGADIVRITYCWYLTPDLDPAWEVGGTGWVVRVHGDAPLDVAMPFPVPVDDLADFTPALHRQPARERDPLRPRRPARHPRRRRPPAHHPCRPEIHGGPRGRLTVPIVRGGTWDDAIRASVAHEYPTVPESFAPGEVVVDLGCHTGAFCQLAAARGATVIGYEANRENHALAAINTARLPAVAIRHAAVWRSDGHGTSTLRFTPSSNPANTGGGSVMFDRPEDHWWALREGPDVHGTGGVLSMHPVPTVALDDVLTAAGPVRFLKLDVEGAEFPILLRAAVSTWCRRSGASTTSSPTPRRPTRPGGPDRHRPLRPRSAPPRARGRGLRGDRPPRPRLSPAGSPPPASADRGEVGDRTAAEGRAGGVEVAAGEHAAGHDERRRLLLGAHVHRVGAPGAEPTARRWVGRATGSRPASTTRGRDRCTVGLGTGIADSSAWVYGCVGDS